MRKVLDGAFCFSEAPWLSWNDISYGLERGFINSMGVVEYAIKSLAVDSPSEQYELACLAGDTLNDVREYVNRLACNSASKNEITEKTWIYLVFLCVFRNRDQYEDPLGVVEDLYADFGYPESIAPIVRYMPAVSCYLEGEEHIMERWSEILESFRLELQCNCY